MQDVCLRTDNGGGGTNGAKVIPGSTAIIFAGPAPISKPASTNHTPYWSGPREIGEVKLRYGTQDADWSAVNVK